MASNPFLRQAIKDPFSSEPFRARLSPEKPASGFLSVDFDDDDETDILPMHQSARDVIARAQELAARQPDGLLHSSDLTALLKEILARETHLFGDALSELFDLLLANVVPMTERVTNWLEDLLPPTVDVVITRRDLKDLQKARRAKKALNRALKDLVEQADRAGAMAEFSIVFDDGYTLNIDVVTLMPMSRAQLQRRIDDALLGADLEVRTALTVRGPTSSSERERFYGEAA